MNHYKQMTNDIKTLDCSKGDGKNYKEIRNNLDQYNEITAIIRKSDQNKIEKINEQRRKEFHEIQNLTHRLDFILDIRGIANVVPYNSRICKDIGIDAHSDFSTVTTDKIDAFAYLAFKRGIKHEIHRIH